MINNLPNQKNRLKRAGFVNKVKRRIDSLKIKISNLLLPDEDISLNKKKWDFLAQKNAEYYVWTEKENPSEEEFRNSGLRDFTNIVKADSILQTKLNSINATSALEVGCGVGRITEFLTQDFEEVYGIDISGKMIELAKQRLPLKKLHFIENDGETMPLESEIIDFVFSHATFHHMPSYKVVEANFREVFRVLKRGGCFKVQLRGTEVSRGNWFYGVWFDKKRIEQLSKKIGFDIIYIKTLFRREEKKYFIVLLEKSTSL